MVTAGRKQQRTQTQAHVELAPGASGSVVPAPMMQLPFGEALRLRRMRLGLTQRDIGRRLGVGASTVTKWEQRQRPMPDSNRLSMIATAYEADEQDIRAGKVPSDMYDSSASTGVQKQEAVVVPRPNPLAVEGRAILQEIADDAGVIAQYSPQDLEALARVARALRVWSENREGRG